MSGSSSVVPPSSPALLASLSGLLDTQPITSQPTSDKKRKPYTITKPRESWTNEEHQLFLDALQMYERDWKKIGQHIPTKSIIQIRSHAQKYFIKMAKMGMKEYIPPPSRPKRAPKRGKDGESEPKRHKGDGEGGDDEEDDEEEAEDDEDNQPAATQVPVKKEAASNTTPSSAPSSSASGAGSNLHDLASLLSSKDTPVKAAAKQKKATTPQANKVNTELEAQKLKRQTSSDRRSGRKRKPNKKFDDEEDDDGDGDGMDDEDSAQASTNTNTDSTWPAPPAANNAPVTPNRKQGAASTILKSNATSLSQLSPLSQLSHSADVLNVAPFSIPPPIYTNRGPNLKPYPGVHARTALGTQPNLSAITGLPLPLPLSTDTSHNDEEGTINDDEENDDAENKPEFAKVYSFLGSLFDPSSTSHIEDELERMTPMNREIAQRLMQNLASNLTPTTPTHQQNITTPSFVFGNVMPSNAQSSLPDSNTALDSSLKSDTFSSGTRYSSLLPSATSHLRHTSLGSLSSFDVLSPFPPEVTSASTVVSAITNNTSPSLSSSLATAPLLRRAGATGTTILSNSSLPTIHNSADAPVNSVISRATNSSTWLSQTSTVATAIMSNTSATATFPTPSISSSPTAVSDTVDVMTVHTARSDDGSQSQADIKSETNESVSNQSELAQPSLTSQSTTSNTLPAASTNSSVSSIFASHMISPTHAASSILASLSGQPVPPPMKSLTLEYPATVDTQPVERSLIQHQINNNSNKV